MHCWKKTIMVFSCLLPQRFSLQRPCGRGGELIGQSNERCCDTSEKIYKSSWMTYFSQLQPNMETFCLSSAGSVNAADSPPSPLPAALLFQHRAPSASGEREPAISGGRGYPGIALAVGSDNEELAVALFGQEVAALVSSHLLR